MAGDTSKVLASQPDAPGSVPAAPAAKAVPSSPSKAPAPAASASSPASQEGPVPLRMPERLKAFSWRSAPKGAFDTARARLAVFLRPEGRPLRLMAAAVLLPALVVFLYLALWSSNIYISEAKFALRGQNTAPSLDSLSSLFRISTSTQSDSYIVLNYISSLDMVNKLNAKLDLRAHYADRAHDFWFRLAKGATQDDMRRYWQWATSTSYDPDTGILSVAVKAFSPEMAHKICQGILENSEALVNAMNARAREDAISQARQEVGRAEERIRAAQAAMKRYRESTVILDPHATASGLYGLVNQMEGEVTKTSAELAEALSFMKADSPKVVTLRNRLEILEKQLQTEKQRLAGALDKDMPLSALISEFQSLTLEEEFARKQLTSAMASLETARVQADAQSLYIEPFEQPTLPDESLYPRPVFFTFIFIVTTLLLLGLVSLIIAAVREHAGF